MRDKLHGVFPALIVALAMTPIPAIAQQESAGAQQEDQADVQESVVVQRPDATPTVVLEFYATGMQGGDHIDEALEMARDPHVARLAVSADVVTGALVFQDVAAFTDWRGTEMGAFFEPLGGPDAVQTALRVTRAGLLQASDPRAARGAMRDISIEYSSADNEATGDADVDAVTVICSGDDADCKPSN